MVAGTAAGAATTEAREIVTVAVAAAATWARTEEAALGGGSRAETGAEKRQGQEGSVVKREEQVLASGFGAERPGTGPDWTELDWTYCFNEMLQT